MVVNTLIKPASVIVSHANEPSTKDGMLIDGTRTVAIIKACKVPVHLPLSGRTMTFGSRGNCLTGC